MDGEKGGRGNLGGTGQWVNCCGSNTDSFITSKGNL